MTIQPNDTVLHNRMEQIKFDYFIKSISTLQWSSALNKVILTLVLYFLDVNFYYILWWLVGVGLTTLIRLAHLKSIKKVDSNNSEKVQKLVKQGYGTLLLQSLNWSFAMILFIDVDGDYIVNMIMVGQIFLILTSGVGLYFYYRYTIMFQHIGLLVPAITFFAITESPYFLLLFFIGALYSMSFIRNARLLLINFEEAITLRLKNELLVEKLEMANAEAELANQSKTRFLAAASHDLRQPLYTLFLLIDRINVRTKEAESSRLLTIVSTTLRSMSTMFDGLLDISKLDSKAVTPEISSFGIESILRPIITEQQILANQKNLTFRERIHPFWTIGDVSMVSQILRNLINNAVKYTEQGGILVGTRLRGSTFNIEVWDTGNGIKASEQDKIFEEFYQIKNSNRDRSKGTGLGLSLVKRQCELLDIPLSFRSEHNRGSVFSIQLPLSPTPDTIINPRVEAVIDTDLNGTSILLVDDNEDILTGLALLLSDYGVCVETATTVAQVHEKLQQFAPDILVSDYHLEDNVTAKQVLDITNEELGYSIPTLIITGTSSSHEILATFRQSHPTLKVLLKPVEPEALIDTIVELLNQPHDA